MTLDLSPVRAPLVLLYGPSLADGLTHRLEALLQKHRAPLVPPPSAGAWTERDAFLIAYPDQIHDPAAQPLETLWSFSRRHLAGILSGIHVLPFFPSSSDDGFSVMDYRLVDPQFGDWDDVGRFGQDFRLMADLVLNHASAQGAWFQAFQRGEEPYRRFFLAPDSQADWSQVVRPRTSPLFTPFPTHAGERRLWTTFGPDQIDLDFRAPDVLLEMADILLDYIAHGIQMIRLDAVTYIWKEAGTPSVHRPEGHAVIRFLRALLDIAAPWARLITETNVPHEQNIAYFGQGDEADLVYQFPLPPLVCHTLLSGNSERLSHWAADLRPPPAGTTFFNFLASHDGIGVYPVHQVLTPAELDRLSNETLARDGAVSRRTAPGGAELPYELNVNLLDLLTRAGRPDDSVDRFLVAHGILLAIAGIPAIYFHSLVGSRGDRLAVRKTGIPRRVNREKLSLTSLEFELERAESERRRVFDGLGALLKARRSSPAFRPEVEQEVIDAGPHVFALRRGPVLCLHEVGGEAREVELPMAFRRGRDLFGGASPEGPRLGLQAYQSRWISAEA